MKNNKENKKLFFAQYYGQKIMRSTGWSEDFMVEDKYRGFEVEPRICVEHFYLELKPYSEITDSEADEIIRLLNNAGVLSKHELLNYLNYLSPYGGLDADVVDTLRKMGYAVRWMGLSIDEQISYGWIKFYTPPVV